MEQPIRREVSGGAPAPVFAQSAPKGSDRRVGPRLGLHQIRDHDSSDPEPFTREQMDEIVDEVVERIEQRVIDELERRGRRADPGVF